MENTGVNFSLRVGSGSPYSRQSNITAAAIGGGSSFLDGSLNGSRKPWRTTINMRIDRDILVKWGKKENEDAKNAKPYDPDNQAMVDPIRNYPDPFVSMTTIEYRVAKISRVSILILNEQNERVAYIVSGYRKPGIYTAEFDAKNLPAGVYTAILTLDKLKVRERMVKLDDQEAILPDSF